MHTKKQDFFDTPAGKEIETDLRRISESDDYITGPSYSPNTGLYINNSMTFVEKHLAYMRNHPKLDPVHYLSNLKLSSRKHRS